MSFASLSFLAFFAVVLAVCAVGDQPRFRRDTAKAAARRQWFLLAASYVFYGWWDARFCLLMLALTLIAWSCGLAVTALDARAAAAGNGAAGAAARRLRRAVTITGVAAPLAALAFFKYADFFIGSFAAAFGVAAPHALRVILPVGISFYTFQSLSYTIDVARGVIPADKSFRRLALYIAFFPQLVAGPIIKASDFLPQIDPRQSGPRVVTAAGLSAGLQIFVFGLFKKIVLADHLSVFVDDVFAAPRAFHAVTLLLAAAAYSLQIYLDFSGYSDMATGCAKCLGYDFQRNFNLPYVSRDVSAFWKRWHISLSSWLKTYLYISLGGNRRGPARTYLNNFLTMLLGGLWHGASWTFVFWGALHGAALCVHKFLTRRVPAPPAWLSIPLTNMFVAFCWIFFRAPTFAVALDVITGIVTWRRGLVQIHAWAIAAFAALLAATLAAARRARSAARRDPAPQTAPTIDGFYPLLDLSRFWHLAAFFVELGLLAGLAYTGSNPFIYFQF